MAFARETHSRPTTPGWQWGVHAKCEGRVACHVRAALAQMAEYEGARDREAVASGSGGEATQGSPPLRERAHTSISRLTNIKAHVTQSIMLRSCIWAAWSHSLRLSGNNEARHPWGKDRLGVGLCPDHTSRLDSAGSSISE